MEILALLPAGAVVLDLGSGSGSFDSALTQAVVVRADREPSAHGAARANFVQADAAALPFRRGAFDAVVCNHSLEHFDDLEAALREIGRATKRGGMLCISVPDSNALCDRLYRWLARGGGHVNRFHSPEDLIARIEQLAGLRHVATRFLLASFSYLNPCNRRTRAPRRLLLLAGGNEVVLVTLNGLLRLIDRLAGTRLALYGWISYFGETRAPVPSAAWANVCARCGSGHPSIGLEDNGRLRLRRLLYRCPRCEALNFFTPDSAYRRLRVTAADSAS